MNTPSMARLHFAQLLMGLLTIATPLLPAQQTSFFRANLQHSGEYEAAGVHQLHGVQWSFATDGQLIASPAIAGDQIYAASTAGTLYALDRHSGKCLWKYAVKGRITSTPAIVNGIVYFAAYDGFFYALKATDGALLWKHASHGERRFAAPNLHGMQPAAESHPDPWDNYLSSPAVWQNIVYFGSGDGNIYALRANDGAMLWQFKTGNVVHASPAIADGMLFIGSWDCNFYALDALTGKEKWHYQTGHDAENHNQEGIQSSAAIVDGIVYFGSRDSHLYALDEWTGAVRWINSTDYSWVLASPAVSHGIVYYPTSDSSKLIAAEAKSGKILYSIGFDGWPIFSSPAVADSMLYIGSTQGSLSAIDLKQKQIVWTYQTKASIAAQTSLKTEDKNGSYFAAFGNPPFSFYDDVMAVYNKLLSTGSVLSSPVIADCHVYFGSTDGKLYALE